ncbi:MAG: hypothetical protein ABFC84_18340 [Veillonellales bacterium]
MSKSIWDASGGLKFLAVQQIDERFHEAQSPPDEVHSNAWPTCCHTGAASLHGNQCGLQLRSVSLSYAVARNRCLIWCLFLRTNLGRTASFLRYRPKFAGDEVIHKL